MVTKVRSKNTFSKTKLIIVAVVIAVSTVVVLVATQTVQQVEVQKELAL